MANDSEIARKYMQLAHEKKSLVCLAADQPTMQGLNELVDEVGKYIVALKTHVDLVDDWNVESWARFCNKARDAGLLVFEDRKFADIGKISRNQMSGLYDIKSWADLVTAHLISGVDIIDSIQSSWVSKGRVGGVLLLAQMSSRGNLLTPEYSDSVVNTGKTHPGVFGFIGNGSRPDEIVELRSRVGDEKMIWTPGVNLSAGDGEMGQRYGGPKEAVLAGSDCVIVGSGIYRADNPALAAAAYARASWEGLLERVK